MSLHVRKPGGRTNGSSRLSQTLAEPSYLGTGQKVPVDEITAVKTWLCAYGE